MIQWSFNTVWVPSIYQFFRLMIFKIFPILRGSNCLPFASTWVHPCFWWGLCCLSFYFSVLCFWWGVCCLSFYFSVLCFWWGACCCLLTFLYYVFGEVCVACLFTFLYYVFGEVCAARLFTFLYYVFCFVYLRPLSCVPNVVCVSGLCILAPSIFSNIYLNNISFQMVWWFQSRRFI